MEYTHTQLTDVHVLLCEIHINLHICDHDSVYTKLHFSNTCAYVYVYNVMGVLVNMPYANSWHDSGLRLLSVQFLMFSKSKNVVCKQSQV